MSWVLESIVRRHMRRSRWFQGHDGTRAIPVALSLSPQEKIIGWRTNPPPCEGAVLVFTTQALHHVDGGQRLRIPWAEITNLGTGPGSDAGVHELLVQTSTQSAVIRFAVPLTDVGGRSDDSFAPFLTADECNLAARVGDGPPARFQPSPQDHIVHTVVRRYMKYSPWLAWYDGSQPPPLPVAAESGEEIVGWCSNPPPWEACVVLFSTTALYSSDGRATIRIPWSDIVEYDGPKSKQDATGLTVHTARGDHFIRLAGSYGRAGNLKDAFGLGMVLRALMDRADGEGATR